MSWANAVTYLWSVQSGETVPNDSLISEGMQSSAIGVRATLRSLTQVGEQKGCLGCHWLMEVVRTTISWKRIFKQISDLTAEGTKREAGVLATELRTN